jgi:hypothetical protein
MQYITAVLAPGETERIEKAFHGERVTKALLREAAEGTAIGDIQFVSTSQFHRPGSWFRLDEAVNVYGPVGIQLRLHGSVAMIEADGATVTVR